MRENNTPSTESKRGVLPERLTVGDHILRAGLSQNESDLHTGFLKQASEVGSRTILVQAPPKTPHNEFAVSLNRLQKLGFISYVRDESGKNFKITIIKE